MYGYFGVYWKHRPLTLGEFIEQLHGFLKQLQTVHPLLRDWQLVGERREQRAKIEPDLSNLASLAQKHAWDKGTPKNRFTNLSEMMEPSLNSVSRVGYILHIENRDEKAKDVDHIGLLISAGASSERLGSAITLRYLPGSPFGQPDIAIKIFMLLVECWNPSFGLVSSDVFREFTYSQNDGRSIGWMTYFANSAIGAALPKDVMQRPFGNQGVLISISPEMPLPGDAQAEDKAIRVAQALRQNAPLS